MQNYFPSVNGRDLSGRLPTSADRCFLIDWWRFHFQICCITQGTQTRALKQPRGVRWRFKREGTYVYLWLIHVDVWQKPTQYCKAIILQLKIIFKKENKKRDSISKRPETIIKSGLVMWGSAWVIPYAVRRDTTYKRWESNATTKADTRVRWPQAKECWQQPHSGTEKEGAHP